MRIRFFIMSLVIFLAGAGMTACDEKKDDPSSLLVLALAGGGHGIEDTDHWNKKIDAGENLYENARSVAVDAQGNVWVFGAGYQLVSGTSLYDMWIKKFDKNGIERDIHGSVEACKSIGNPTPCSTNSLDLVYDGNGSDDYARSIAVDPDGYVYAAGVGTNLVTSGNNTDWWIKKFDSNGAEQDFNNGAAACRDGSPNPCSTNGYDIAYDGTAGNDTAVSLDTDSSGNVYVAGYGYHLVSGTSQADWWIKKFSSAGVEQAFDTESEGACGGGTNNPCSTNTNDIVYDGNGDSDVIYKIVVPEDGVIYAAGYGSYMVSGTSSTDWWIKKFDSIGTEQSFSAESAGACRAALNPNPCSTSGDDIIFHHDDTDGNSSEEVYSLAVDGDGNVYAAGRGERLASISSSYDWWLKKFDSNGNEDTTNWDKIFDGGHENWDWPGDIAVASDGTVFVAGFGSCLVGSATGMDWLIKSYSADGVEDTENWNKAFDGNNGDDNITSMAIYGKSIYIVGYGKNLVGLSSDNDWWIKKFQR